MGEGGYKQINKTLNIGAFEDYLLAQCSRLPQLPNVEQISPRVIRILGQNAGKFTLQGTNTYIVGTGSKRILIDTAQGYREWADLLRSTCESMGFSISAVLLTHWHGDHTLGVPDLLRMWPALSDKIFKNAPDQGQQDILDGQVFQTEGASIRAVHAPGHSHDHMCFVIKEDDAMVTGDNILGHGSSAVEELSTYMDGLRHMQWHCCAIGYPAHGAVIKNLKAKISFEIEQKMGRERRIIQFLTKHRNAGGASLTLKELVSKMHGGHLDPVVAEKAIEPFTDEILRKLAGDGLVAFQMRRGEKRWIALQVAEEA
ncbi:Lactamase-like protein 2 [Elsinoe fawcettii]|nr:Lactamase-like protein 2 [Elsinoe fawcettii]